MSKCNKQNVVQILFIVVENNTQRHHKQEYPFETRHPVHTAKAFTAIRTVWPLTQISLASARAFSIPLEKNPLQTQLTPFRGGQRALGSESVSRRSRDERCNRRILFSAIDIARARARIKLSQARERCLALGGVCQSVRATRLSG